MPPTTTRTTNPLPFQDLEPKRFEDLVRQLAYEFRPWRRLEATGRSGSDEGFDARGYEIVDATVEADPDDDGDVGTIGGSADRLWLVQCKRERAIGPSKAAKYLAEIVIGDQEPLYGVIFSAACDFSKATRDKIADWCRQNSVAEWHIWGRGELEDLLFQPRNDHLLFAYFGISLVIRRRSQATNLRGEVAMKRKLKSTVLTTSDLVLVRDPTAIGYPHVEEGKTPTKWWVYSPEELSHRGLMLSVAWYHAYIDPETGEWDAAEAVASKPEHHPWRITDEAVEALRTAAREAWLALPEPNRGWLKVSGAIPYRNILAVDDIGDDIMDGVHLYVTFEPEHGPFAGGFWQSLDAPWSPWARASPDSGKRIQKFPEALRHPRTE